MVTGFYACSTPPTTVRDPARRQCCPYCSCALTENSYYSRWDYIKDSFLSTLRRRGQLWGNGERASDVGSKRMIAHPKAEILKKNISSIQMFKFKFEFKIWIWISINFTEKLLIFIDVLISDFTIEDNLQVSLSVLGGQERHVNTTTRL